MVKKKGRPVSENPKDLLIKARVDKDTVEKLDNYCKKNNTTRSTVIRKGINEICDNPK